MSYRIRPDATVRTNVRRLVRRELARALAALDEPGALGLQETVHDVRKRCKKVRGRPPAGAPRARRRSTGAPTPRCATRPASCRPSATPTRRSATFDELIAATHGDRLPGGALDGVRAGLVGARHEAERADACAPARRAAERLARVRERVERWSPDDDVAILLSGLVATTTGRGRRAFRALARRSAPTRPSTSGASAPSTAGTTPGCCSPVAPSALGPLAKRLKDLSDGLGDEHDLAVLRGTILAAPADFGGRRASEAIALDRRRAGRTCRTAATASARGSTPSRPRAFGGARRAATGRRGTRSAASARSGRSTTWRASPRSPRRATASCRRATSCGRSTTRRSIPRSARSPMRPNGRSGRRSPSRARPGPRRPPRAVSEPLLELEIGPGAPEERQGLRVLDDGRLEYRGHVDVDLDAGGQAELARPARLAPALDLHGARAGRAAPRDRRGGRPAAARRVRPRHPSDPSAGARLALRVGDRMREVTIHGWPGTRVAALERLWRRLFELHQPPGETSVWRVWTDGGPVERLVDAEVAQVPVLAAALRASPSTQR